MPRDNRTRVKNDAVVSTSRYFQIILDTGWAAFDPERNEYLLRPSRGSGGFSLYGSEHTAKRMGKPHEHLQRARLVLELL